MTKEESIDKVQEGKNNYYQECEAFAINFVRKQTEEFTSETIREAYEANNKLIPHEPRVWGAVMRTLSRDNLIAFQGYTKYKASQGHQKPSAVWKSLITKK